MSTNFNKYFEDGGSLKQGVLEKHVWLRFLTCTDNVYVNAERLESMGSLSGRETLMYVIRSLDILDEVAGRDKLGSRVKEIVGTTIKSRLSFSRYECFVRYFIS